MYHCHSKRVIQINTATKAKLFTKFLRYSCT